MRIGLALSGGGFRATGFHLGVLARLAEQDQLEKVNFLSTVSGGSVCAALVYASSGFEWPTSDQFKEEVVSRVRELMTTQDMQRGLVWRVLTSALQSPLSLLETRADDFSTLLREDWGITASLSELPENPRWMINATCYETGRNWRFERERMGDYVFGSTADTDIPLSDAVAASAAVPGLVGPLVLDINSYRWSRPPPEELATSRSLHLWDGGVYDNLGLEGLHDFDTGWEQGIDFLIASSASGRPVIKGYRRWEVILRVIDITTYQVLGVRSRAILERIKVHKDQGSYVHIGNTCEYVLTDAREEALRRGDLEEAKRLEDAIPRLCSGSECLNADQAEELASMKTTAGRLSQKRFADLFRHGFEVADYTLYAYHPDEFDYIGYGESHWG